MSEERKSFWAIIQLMGHATISGYLEEDEIAGHGMLKITVPATTTCKQFHRFVEPKAVYSIDPVDETTARAKAERLQYKPIDEWDIRPMLEDIVKKADAASLLKMRPDLVQRVLPEQTAESAPAGEIMEVEYEELEIGYEYQTKGGWRAESFFEDEINGIMGMRHYPVNSEEYVQLWHKKDGAVDWAGSNKDRVYMSEVGYQIDLSTKKPIERNG